MEDREHITTHPSDKSQLQQHSEPTNPTITRITPGQKMGALHYWNAPQKLVHCYESLLPQVEAGGLSYEQEAASPQSRADCGQVT